MQTLKLDENNNLVLDKNNLQILNGIEACAQDTRTRVGICRGENPYNTSQGADYFGEILGKMGGQGYVRDIIRERIGDNEEIVQINSLEIFHNKETMQVVAEISSIYGVFTI